MIDRARSRMNEEVGTLPPDAPAVKLDCASEEPATPYGGWRIGLVDGFPLQRAYLRIWKADTEVLVESLDGVPLEEIWYDEDLIARAAKAFAIPPEYIAPFKSLEDTPAHRALLAGPLFDM